MEKNGETNMIALNPFRPDKIIKQIEKKFYKEFKKKYKIGDILFSNQIPDNSTGGLYRILEFRKEHIVLVSDSSPEITMEIGVLSWMNFRPYSKEMKEKFNIWKEMN